MTKIVIITIIAQYCKSTLVWHKSHRVIKVYIKLEMCVIYIPTKLYVCLCVDFL